MPSRIKMLSEHVANQIAAGEVIERPASVVKELVENALDSGATQVEVRTRAGGRSLIEVTDNGCGMNRDDALLCLERHATSKLRETEDLRHLLSYGFRGEALPSIASVSRFLLRTREATEISGTEVVVNGGKIISVQEAGLAPGTQIEVRSLFYNLPARRKFMRTEPTELAHVEHQLILAGLSRPEVGFHLQHDEQAPRRWAAGQDLARRIIAIYGEEWFAQLVPVELEEEGLRVTGFIGKPGVSRGQRSEQITFVNHRPVESRTIHYALQEGYHNALMRGRYPVTVLFVEMNPEGVDVNIHPAKREVRFHDEPRIRHFLVRAIYGALREYQAAPVRVTVPERRAEPESPRELPLSSTESQAPVEDAPIPAPAVFLPKEENKMRPEPEPIGENLALRFLGVVARLYIVAESRDGLVLIDQHAAHERIMFEFILARLAREEIISQRLLLPITVTFPPRESDFLAAQIDSLQRIGLEISLFGSGSFLVDGLPPMVRVRDIEAFIRDLVSELQTEGGETRKARRLSEETVAKKACRLAVKANDPLGREECEALLRDLLSCDLPYTCPHGRPTMILFSKGELEKKFGRLG